ncbi:MAG: hypothetical protein NT105_24590, partial [Verrucomicrobia bacterium]|nr:hypothetical protein [Verrucomicrobiota bacterium]
MLRRWIQELADFLQIANPLPEKASAEDVDNAFAALLGRAAQQRRVVVLMDALNQFEPTVRARHLTWLKAKSWPPNARLIATSLPEQNAVALSQWVGVEELDLPPLTEADAEQIAKKVWQRYHRQFNREVFQVLAGKRQPDGVASAGNPLWLNLALEQLNLLDADDFARAEREFTGAPAERLRAMVLDVARRLPADVEGLFDWMLEHTEKVHGAAWTRALATAIALSRSGWRETDLLALVPRFCVAAEVTRRSGSAGVEASNPPSHDSGYENFDAVRLAALRRAFRGQAVKRGALEQLDFFHAQMRAAVLRRCVADEELRRKLHAALANHLLGLSETDALRASETMHHLIEADDRPRAARFYASVPDPSPALTAGTQTLANRILVATDAEANTAVDWTTSLLAEPGLELAQVAALANRFQFDLNDALENEGRLGPRRRLLDATRAAGERLAAADPSN